MKINFYRQSTSGTKLQSTNKVYAQIFNLPQSIPLIFFPLMPLLQQ